jgi:hypothetical protein
MKCNTLNSCLISLCFLLLSCKKEVKLEAENTQITGEMTYKQTGLKVLSANTLGQPTFVEVAYSGEGVLNIIGKVTMKSSFIFDILRGESKNFSAIYTDEKGNTIKMIGSGKVVPNKEWDLYINEKAIAGTGRYNKITPVSGGISGTSMKQDSLNSGKGRIEWTLTF